MPKTNVIVDFESYYNTKESVSAGDLGLYNYITGSYAYLVSIVAPGLRWVGTIEEAQSKFHDNFWDHPNFEFWAANSNFDQVWKEHLWPGAQNRPWQCILDRGAGSQLPGNLAGVTKAVLGEKIDKSMRDFMNGKHWSGLTPEAQRDMRDYCLTDSVKEAEVLSKIPELSPVETRIAAYTRMTNRRGVRIDTERLARDFTMLQEANHHAFMSIPWHNGDKPLSVVALAKWAHSQGLPCPASLDKNDEECIDLMEVHPGLAEVVGFMRSYRKTNTMLKKISSLSARLVNRPDGWIAPMELIYCGARHTRRWSCRGFNFQNLDAEPYLLNFPDHEPHPIDPRAWLIPRDGKSFLIRDYSQIEPRCLNWLVGNDELLDLMRKGFSIYEAYARSAGTWTKTESLKGTPLYKAVKAQVLGLGYGMGAGAYVAHSLKYGVPITFEESKATVKDWRNRNKKIVGCWADFDKLIRKGMLSKDRGLEITMPSGEPLRHFHMRAWSKLITDEETGEVRTVRGYESYTAREDFSFMSKQKSLWGGVLTENVTQRMARDILAGTVVDLEDAGVPVLFTAHDEGIMEVDTASRDEAAEYVDERMMKPPDWAEGLPLGVEGQFADHYLKMR